MHLRTLLILALLVAGLGAAVFLQSSREEERFSAQPLPLFEGVLPERIDRIRVDNLERSVQLLLERREGQGWSLVDPIDAPAEGALVQVLIDALAGQEAHPLEDPDLEQLSLAPPRAVVEFEQAGLGGTHRLELGANDLDGQYVVVRADGAVVRTLRTFESLLDRPLDEWRSRSIVRGLRPFSVVEFRRRGQLAFAAGDEPVELAMEAVNEDGWYVTSPWRARLDAGGVGIVVQTAATLRASGFVDDAPVSLEVYGLHEPAAELELVEAGGRVETLKFAPYGPESWAVISSSDPRVYAVSLDTMLALSMPLEAMVERGFARLVRERVQRVTLRTGERDLVLEPAGPNWTLSARTGSGEVETRPADPARAGDLLDELERARILALLSDVPFESAPGGPIEILIEHDGRTLGGELGAAYAMPGGGEGVLFRRAGDELVTLVDAGLAELAATPVQHFQNRQLVLAQELSLSRIELRRGGLEQVYVRNELGRWSLRGTEAESRAFAIQVDRLLSIRRAEREPEEAAVGEGDPAAADEPIQVTLVQLSGALRTYALAPHTGELDAFADADGQALIPGGLYGALAALFGTE